MFNHCDPKRPQQLLVKVVEDGVLGGDLLDIGIDVLVCWYALSDVSIL